MKIGIFWVLILFAVLPDAKIFGQHPYVAAIVDGDRLVLSDGRRVQLIGVNAPERFSSARLQREAVALGKSPEAYQRLGEIAASFLGSIVLGQQVNVLQDVLVEKEMTSSSNVYTLVYIELLNNPGQGIRSINEEMIKSGYATVDLRYSFEKKEAYLSLERNARTEGSGLWAPEAQIQPVLPVQSRDSRVFDRFSSCRDEPGCVWISTGSSQTSPGYWTRLAGKLCSCVNQ